MVAPFLPRDSGSLLLRSGELFRFQGCPVGKWPPDPPVSLLTLNSRAAGAQGSAEFSHPLPAASSRSVESAVQMFAPALHTGSRSFSQVKVALAQLRTGGCQGSDASLLLFPGPCPLTHRAPAAVDRLRRFVFFSRPKIM